MFLQYLYNYAYLSLSYLSYFDPDISDAIYTCFWLVILRLFNLLGDFLLFLRLSFKVLS
jgi:hypothetical protein